MGHCLLLTDHTIKHCSLSTDYVASDIVLFFWTDFVASDIVFFGDIGLCRTLGFFLLAQSVVLDIILCWQIAVSDNVLCQQIVPDMVLCWQMVVADIAFLSTDCVLSDMFILFDTLGHIKHCSLSTDCVILDVGLCEQILASTFCVTSDIFLYWQIVLHQTLLDYVAV